MSVCRPFRAWLIYWTTYPGASLADSLCPGLLSFGLSALRNERAVQGRLDLLQIHHAEAEVEDAGRGAVGGGDLEDGLATVFAAQEIQHAGGGHHLELSPHAVEARGDPKRGPISERLTQAGAAGPLPVAYGVAPAKGKGHLRWHFRRN